MMILVKATEIAYDIMMNPVILLLDEDYGKALPIWIGPFEANSISMAFQGIYLDRPLTHDLLIDVCAKLDAKISMVLINDVVNDNYIAELHMWHGGENVIIDARPSDAIALAVRAKAPIYLTNKVAAGFLALNELLSEEQQQELKRVLHHNRAKNTNKSVH